MKYSDFFTDKLVGKTFFRRGTGKPCVLKTTLFFGLKGQKPTTHVFYITDGEPVRMVKASAFMDMFAETPMVPVAEPRREKTAEKYRRNGWLNEKAS